MNLLEIQLKARDRQITYLADRLITTVPKQEREKLRDELIKDCIQIAKNTLDKEMSE